jgi:hypothetical protein
VLGTHNHVNAICNHGSVFLGGTRTPWLPSSREWKYELVFPSPAELGYSVLVAKNLGRQRGFWNRRTILMLMLPVKTRGSDPSDLSK